MTDVSKSTERDGGRRTIRGKDRGSVLMDSGGSQRKVFARLSILSGNLLQVAGMAAAVGALMYARTASSQKTAVAAMLLAWLLLYFFCHAIAHWAVGRAAGIRFRFYTVGGTGNPQGWPAGLRWIFEHLPFFGVQTEKISMANASPRARAWMWSAGVTSSAVLPVLSAYACWRFGIPWSGWFLVFAMVWSAGALSSNWRSETGDYAKARRALSGR